jgi:hypothetical protein
MLLATLEYINDARPNELKRGFVYGYEHFEKSMLTPFLE